MRNEVIKLLKAPTGPSREVDRAIARAVGWHRVEPRFLKGKHGGWIAPEDFIGTYSDGSPILDSLHGTDIHRDVPPYTSDVSSAISLIPSGYRRRTLVVEDGRAACWLWLPIEQAPDGSWGSLSVNEAVAICLAFFETVEKINDR